MRNHFKYIVAILLLLFVSVSCTSNFEDVSKNPNASDEALPQALLAPALTSVVKANMSRTRSLTNELMQVTVLMGDIEGRIFRYDIRKSVADYLWNNWYVQLTNFKDMYETAQTLYTVESDKTYNTYMGISLICQCWVFSMLTDTYGDIPYTEACQGKKGILTPVFDRQEDIYTDIFAKLEQANELLANGSDLPEDQVICDPLFQGNALKWRKLSNSLYLRLLLRVSGKEEETAAAKIAEILEERPTDYPIMTSNDDSAILRWTGEQPYVSPFYTLRDSDWRTYVLAEFFLDNLNRWNDPRRPKWADTSNGEYAGVPSGYPVGEEVSARSRLPLALKNDPRLGNIMNYAELEFIITEATVKRYISADAETHYTLRPRRHIWTIPLSSGTMAKVWTTRCPESICKNIIPCFTQTYSNGSNVAEPDTQSCPKAPGCSMAANCRQGSTIRFTCRQPTGKITTMPYPPKAKTKSAPKYGGSVRTTNNGKRD